MRRVVIPAEFLHLLGDMSEAIEFVDAEGKVIGNFCPYVDYRQFEPSGQPGDTDKFIDDAEVPPGARRFRDVIDELSRRYPPQT